VGAASQARAAVIARRQLLAWGAAAAAIPVHAAGRDAGWEALASGQAVIALFRHATAPGVGDPPGLRIGDCRTQRVLDDRGRAEARLIGEAFRRRRIAVAGVLSSRWCRASETASLAFPGQPLEEAAFDSFFADPQAEAGRTARALSILRQWKGPAALVVVTHQVNIRALTEISTASAEGLAVRLDDAGGLPLRVLGRLVL
jgi:phosphohistidine phosphatase SixA